jgi:uncharacterized heparinase superfamily protein
LTRLAVAERIAIAGHALRHGARCALRMSAAPLFLWSRLRCPPPQRLVIAPQDIRTSDPTVADDIYAGYFAFAARIVDAREQSPFVLVGPSVEWESALMGFGWLRHLRAAETSLARENARALVGEWISLHGAPSQESIAWSPPVVSRRLMSWVSQSPLLLEGADADFYARFLKSIGRHVAWLSAQMRFALRGEARLFAAIALTEATLCSDGYARLLRRASKWLSEELDRQVLIDGGHISRNPQVVMDLLFDLLPLRQAFAARNSVAPPQLISAIDRLLPMLRLFRHSDSSLALFNGMGVTAPDMLATLLAYDDALAQPILNAPYSGYQRIEAADAVLLFDSGGPPPPDFSQRAHAGALALELSLDNCRVVGNCGAPIVQRGPLREAARMTAAHSTLELGEESSARLAHEIGLGEWAGGRIFIGPRVSDVSRRDGPESCVIEARHDGYASRFGLVHARTLTLATDGGRLEGVDLLESAGGRKPREGLAYAIRFHLHPTVKAARVEREHGVMLVLPGGQHWLFHASGRQVELEDGAFFAAADGSRAAQQIVIRGLATEEPETRWVFLRGS